MALSACPLRLLPLLVAVNIVHSYFTSYIHSWWCFFHSLLCHSLIFRDTDTNGNIRNRQDIEECLAFTGVFHRLPFDVGRCSNATSLLGVMQAWPWPHTMQHSQHKVTQSKLLPHCPDHLTALPCRARGRRGDVSPVAAG
jgi:hypothetical protein